MKPSSDTIAAIATAPGRGGIGVIRISGNQSEHIATQLCGKLPAPRVAKFACFLDHQGKHIDQGLMIYFPAPGSFTGESVVEIHGHGGMVVLDQILSRLIELGARLAEPGEFTRRAFLNDKIDLTQAEAIADLIDASSQKAVRAALRSLEGEFSQKVNEILRQLIELRMYVESAIDFPEEEIDFISEGQVEQKTQTLLCQVQDLIASATQGKILREGIDVVIMGKPNAGKSSLLNTLAGAERAIVTDIPGTTRDVLKETISIDGLPINIIDTAGLRDSDDPVEQEGVRRAQAQIKQADCLLNIIDVTDSDKEHQTRIISDSFAAQINVYNKIDLVDQSARLDRQNNQTNIYLSAKQKDGIDLLQQQLKQIVGYDSNVEGVFIARRRHLDALNRARKNISDGLNVLKKAAAGELLAEDLLQAQQALNEITGEFTSDDLLGKIFSTFCIGK